METLRDLKRSARRDLHDAMRVSALYFAPAATEGVAVNIRVHTKFQALGALNGGDWAEREDVTPRIVMQPAEAQPARQGVLSVEAGEAYQIGNVHPADGEFITLDVVAMSPAQIAQRFPTATFPDGQPLPPSLP